MTSFAPLVLLVTFVLYRWLLVLFMLLMPWLVVYSSRCNLSYSYFLVFILTYSASSSDTSAGYDTTYPGPEFMTHAERFPCR